MALVSGARSRGTHVHRIVRAHCRTLAQASMSVAFESKRDTSGLCYLSREYQVSITDVRPCWRHAWGGRSHMQEGGRPNRDRPRSFSASPSRSAAPELVEPDRQPVRTRAQVRGLM